MGRLSGKTAIITGASAGFGRGTAYAFAAEGCNLVLTARREERLQEAVKKMQFARRKSCLLYGRCARGKNGD